MDARTLADEIDAELRRHGDQARAEREAAYLKSTIEHLGVTVPATRAMVVGFHRRHADLDRHALLAVVEALWEAPVHERRVAAVELLALAASTLQPADMALLERLVRESRTWALVDGLAPVVGVVVEREPEAAADLDRWATDPDFWVRRAALLALLVPLRQGRGDPDRFFRYADAMLDETEFFIGKAIGWVLRDTAKKRPDLVASWLLPRARRASGLTVREAVKHLPDEQRRAILAAREGADAGAT